ncbi:hypothetical protein ACJRO7_001914 [Eucalyptus globulus]|uniref:Uncharacterized protein n=1 Tax=Eucalyptus globulus TaxID=34317 RepID=A0ABD3LSI5_EUCGL
MRCLVADRSSSIYILHTIIDRSLIPLTNPTEIPTRATTSPLLKILCSLLKILCSPLNQEKEYAQIYKGEAEQKLVEVVNRIKDEEVLVINNEDQAKVFAIVKDIYFGPNNRGFLRRVEIGTTLGDDTKRIIWNQLLKVGMKLENPSLTFKFG